ncbi:hypothetical protein C8R43DRAFT_1128642 [Mycena crocata]|nr:hypothetical protein C8R43DRAFT_1128642 [Mycena crocata]
MSNCPDQPLANETSVITKSTPACEGLRNTLIARCPALNSIWFDGYHFVYRWRRWRDGQVDETFADEEM